MTCLSALSMETPVQKQNKKQLSRGIVSLRNNHTTQTEAVTPFPQTRQKKRRDYKENPVIDSEFAKAILKGKKNPNRSDKRVAQFRNNPCANGHSKLCEVQSGKSTQPVDIYGIAAEIVTDVDHYKQLCKQLKQLKRLHRKQYNPSTSFNDKKQKQQLSKQIKNLDKTIKSKLELGSQSSIKIAELEFVPIVNMVHENYS